MLRAKERSVRPRWPRLARLVAVALLLAVGLFASSLRSPTWTAMATGSEKAVLSQSPASVPAYAPFDLSYIPPDAQGVGAWRPAALFDQPGMKKYALMCNELPGPKQGFVTAVLLERLTGFFLLGKKPLRLSIADVEQVVGTFNLRSIGGRQTMYFGIGGMIRTVKDFDWHKQLRNLFPDMVQRHHAGVAYYRIPTQGGYIYPEISALFPDARTVVLMPQRDLRRWIDHGKEWKTAQTGGSAWKQVERDLAAFYVRPAALPLSEPDGFEPTTTALLQTAERISIGVVDCAPLKVRGWIQCRSPQAGEKWEQSIRGWAAQAADKTKTSSAQQQSLSGEAVLMEMAAALQPVRQGSEVTVRCESSKSFATLVEMGLTAQKQIMDSPPSRREKVIQEGEQ